MGSPREKFDAAVRVISCLPKEGSFKPSNEMLLRFYSLYKQATMGPCRQPKPSFWDLVNKAKWEAWTTLGDMQGETAMLEYVEELKQVIETMPHTPDVEKFLDTLGSFYEVVQDGELTPGAANARDASTAAPGAAATFAIDEPASELSSDGSEEEEEEESHPDDAANRGEPTEEDDEDEFCDTVEPLHGVGAAASTAPAPGGPAVIGRLSAAALPSPAALKHQHHQQTAGAATAASSSLSSDAARQQIRHIRDSLTRLQADVDRIHRRLDGMEVQATATAKAAMALSGGPADVLSGLWRAVFGGVSPRTVALVLLWPVLLQALLRSRLSRALSLRLWRLVGRSRRR